MIKYSDSGVNFDDVGAFRKELISHLRNHGKWNVPLGIGHYAGLIEFGEYYLALHTDGVGTKTILALKHNYLRELGHDLIAMNVNDLSSMNIEAVAMVDYIASSIFYKELGEQLGESLNSALEEADISIIGGETASVPDLINGLDISGTVLGIVKKNMIITGEKISEGDYIIGIPSSGFHSNGYSLIRKILDLNPGLEDEIVGGEKLWKKLLKGTRIYSRTIEEISLKFDLHGMAHITGGGFRNLLRLKQMHYKINYEIDIPEIFKIIIDRGNVSYQEAFQTFNMGVGFVIILDDKNGKKLLDEYEDLIKIGVVEKGNGVSIAPYNVFYANYY